MALIRFNPRHFDSNIAIKRVILQNDNVTFGRLNGRLIFIESTVQIFLPNPKYTLSHVPKYVLILDWQTKCLCLANSK